LRAHAEGIGYAGKAYVGSPLLGYIRSLPADAVIVTNAPHVVYIHTGRDARSLPARYNPSTLKVNDDFDGQVRRIGKEAEARPVVLACFERRRQPYLPTCEELGAGLRLTPLRRFAKDGVAYAVGRRASINVGSGRAADVPLSA
jgi:hypothetical protein